MNRRIFVSIVIDAPADEVWARSQDPGQHQRWDLRFGRIRYLAGDGPQRFRYATFGVAGTGVCVHRRREDGSGTSSLRFASPHPLSPIAEGAGYWRYRPGPAGVEFATGYDYRPRYRWIDRPFRAGMGWATAWSFDRLRISLEHGVSPEAARRRAVLDGGARCGVVVLAVLGSPWLLVPAVALALGWPVPRTVPAARRCARRPADRAGDTPPGDLATLEAA